MTHYLRLAHSYKSLTYTSLRTRDLFDETKESEVRPAFLAYNDVHPYQLILVDLKTKAAFEIPDNFKRMRLDDRPDLKQTIKTGWLKEDLYTTEMREPFNQKQYFYGKQVNESYFCHGVSLNSNFKDPWSKYWKQHIDIINDFECKEVDNALNYDEMQEYDAMYPPYDETDALNDSVLSEIQVETYTEPENYWEEDFTSFWDCDFVQKITGNYSHADFLQSAC